MSYQKAYAPACDRNSAVILDVLRPILARCRTVLEIGSGTGQHAVYFAGRLPHLVWQPSDLPQALDSIHAWRAEAALDNLTAPLNLDLHATETVDTDCDAMVCINTIHIVDWHAVEQLFALAGRLLPPAGVLYVYGPYRYADRPLEPSNERFDEWLKQRDPASGVRQFEAVNALARESGLELQGDVAMPANNRSIWWQKT